MFHRCLNIGQTPHSQDIDWCVSKSAFFKSTWFHCLIWHKFARFPAAITFPWLHVAPVTFALWVFLLCDFVHIYLLTVLICKYPLTLQQSLLCHMFCLFFNYYSQVDWQYWLAPWLPVYSFQVHPLWFTHFFGVPLLNHLNQMLIYGTAWKFICPHRYISLYSLIW